jgi:hypothetical protein
MASNYVDLVELTGDEFLDRLDESILKKENLDNPPWVLDDINHTTYKAWQAILQLQKQKELNIKKYGKVATTKTSNSLYVIKKSEVSLLVGKSPQSIFRTSSFSHSIRIFLDKINCNLLEFHNDEQSKQRNRNKKTGIRNKAKVDIIGSHQNIEKELNKLKAMTTKNVLDLAINQMPLDLRRKLGL